MTWRRCAERCGQPPIRCGANSTLGPAEYRGPVLGLIFLAYAEHRFEEVRPELEVKATARRPVTADDYKARSVLYVPDEARLSMLVELPEAADLGAAVDAAMRDMETHNPELKDVLPKGYQRMEKEVLIALLRLFAPLPRTLSGDAFGLDLRGFPLQLRGRRGEAWRRVLHSVLDRSPHRGDHRALSRPSIRSGLRVRGHVRAVRQVRRPPSGLGHRRPVRLRSRTKGGHGPAGKDEPGAARSLWRDWRLATATTTISTTALARSTS